MSAPRGSQRTLDYLEVLHRLLFPVGEFRPGSASTPIAARVADQLGVSRASAGEMLSRLTGNGLVERGDDRSLALTPQGIEMAEAGIRATRVLELFLADFLGYGAGEVHALASGMRDAFSPEMIDRLHERIGAPERCPHGWPVSGAAGSALQPLSSLEPGDRCRIFGIAEDDSELVSWLFGAGLVPSTKLRVREIQPAAGHLTVGIERKGDVVVGDRAARQVFVTPA